MGSGVPRTAQRLLHICHEAMQGERDAGAGFHLGPLRVVQMYPDQTCGKSGITLYVASGP